jgi:methylmalonyl-CoA mutase cobalamin-binding subunit
MSGSAKPSDLHVPARSVRFVTAAGLFDGHDAAINIMRRILQAQGAEVIHLALAELKDAARCGGNVFAVLMDAARVCSLQQITEAFFEVGGQYRRNI